MTPVAPRACLFGRSGRFALVSLLFLWPRGDLAYPLAARFASYHDAAETFHSLCERVVACARASCLTVTVCAHLCLVSLSARLRSCGTSDPHT